jgi:BirA family transcriptional regulator, biotin operon repressor / biotin---[acetyl-CoA-carboxylase] ligase
VNVTDLRLGQRAVEAGYRLVVKSPTASTNSDAMARATAEGGGPVWCVATEQTAGRGRHGRIWRTAPGNLAASVLVHTAVAPQLAATLGFVAGVALVGALQRSTVFARSRPVLTLKWPNDLMAGDAKLAGILLESRQSIPEKRAVAVGIGINVTSAPTGLAYPTTALAALGGTRDIGVVFKTLSDEWVSAYAMWDEGRGLENILAIWRELAHGVGQTVGTEQDGRTVSGTYEGIDSAGRLLIGDPTGKLTAIGAGEVFFGASGAPIRMEMQ